MKGVSFVAVRMLKLVGICNGVPRITNVDTGADVLGYTEINTQATSMFARTKLHKAWFVHDSDVVNGTRIVDKIDGAKYLIMSVKDEYAGGAVAFKDGTIFSVDEIFSVSRPNSALNSFGRVESDSLVVVAEDVWAMVNPLVIDVQEHADRIIENDKIKLAIQTSVPVAVNDRMTSSTGENFIVTAFSRAEIEGLNMVHVKPDSR